MKVCLVSSAFVPIIPGIGVLYGGGIEAQVYGLAKALTSLCDEVELITIQNHVHSNMSGDGIVYHRIRLPSKGAVPDSMLRLTCSDVAFACSSQRLHEKLDIDLVHCHTKYPAVATLLHHSKRPVVFTAHNWKLWEGIRPQWKSGLAMSAFKFDMVLERFIARKSDKILAVSHAMKKGIVESTGISSKKVGVVSNGVDPDAFFPEIEERTQSVLYVGRIAAEKGIDVLLRAMRLVLQERSDTKLIIVGPEKYGLERGSYGKYLRSLVRTLKMEQNTVFAGIVSMSDLRRMYSQASVLCLPAVWQEPFGLTLLEAMACETPVVGTNVGGIQEIISDCNSGLLVSPNNVKELANAISRILSDGDFARNLGRNGRNAVMQRFTFTRLAGEVYSVYRDLQQ